MDLKVFLGLLRMTFDVNLVQSSELLNYRHHWGSENNGDCGKESEPEDVESTRQEPPRQALSPLGFGHLRIYQGVHLTGIGRQQKMSKKNFGSFFVFTFSAS